MYQVIGTRASRAFRVLWMLEELGVEYEHIPAGPRSDAVRAINPSGKIPCLKDGDAVLTDSVAIITYLADKHHELTFPAGTVDRARQDAMTHRLLDEVDALLWAAARHSFILPQERRVAGLKPAMIWEYENNIKRLSDEFTGPFLMGESMTISDIVLTHCLRWAGMAKFPEPGGTLADYKARMEARPACRRAIDLP